MPKLSIVILSYNTEEVTKDCLRSLEKVKGEVDFEVVVPDNGSNDQTCTMVKKEFPWVRLIENRENLGFAAGNNRARQYCSGQYVLFLNSDTKVPKNTLKISLDYIEKNREIGALSCKVVLPDGSLDKDTRRAFPTPWVALTHLVMRLDRLFPHSKLFARYWYGYLSDDLTHEVDVIQGAFFLARKKVLDEVGWFDEAYFLDGEDIDLCWKIKKRGFKIIYYPEVSILHLKGVSKGKGIHSQGINRKLRFKFKTSGVTSMEIFYRKHLWKKYPFFVNILVILGIRMVKLMRAISVFFK